MNANLTQSQLDELKTRLQQSHRELREGVSRELRESGNGQYLYMTEGAHDAGDQAVADQLAELNLGTLDRHVRELREVEAALARIEDETYGLCSEDDEPIGYPRLKANPTASRCIHCQERYERTHAQPGQHTL
jgi:RNA polymerase-binding protein DksA